jgi:uncharacterized membrane protein YbhN (UPF0104 family)
MARKVIGDPKAGLALRIRQTAEAMTLDGHPDPALLAVVLAVSVIAGIVGAIAGSPREGLVSFLLFALLFSPLLTVLIFNAVRIKTHCSLDRAHGVLQIEERSYTHRVQEEYPLADVSSVIVRRLPSTPLIGGSFTYGVFLALGEMEYLAACGHNEVAVGQDAWRISRFLAVPFEMPAGDSERQSTHPGLLAAVTILYLVPVVVAISAVLFLLEQFPGVNPTFAGLLGAVVISQIGAILAFAYYRTRRPYES